MLSYKTAVILALTRRLYIHFEFQLPSFARDYPNTALPVDRTSLPPLNLLLADIIQKCKGWFPSRRSVPWICLRAEQHGFVPINVASEDVLNWEGSSSSLVLVLSVVFLCKHFSLLFR